MRVFEDNNLWNLKDLLRQIDQIEMALPNFQRNFVWDAKATQELIVSVAKGYPAGSLLRIRNIQPPMFPYREFEHAEPKEGKVPNYLVLDGQQRLTSLYQAFHGKGDTRFFINIKKLIAGDDFEECIFHHRAIEKKARRYDMKVQARELIMPLAALGHEPGGGFATWMLDVSWAYEGNERREVEAALMQVRNQWIAVIDHYQLPVVTLAGSTSAEAVCTIFETLNRAGVKLTAFELLRARYFAKGIDLRDLWTKACDDHPALADFGVDPYTALQVIALSTRDTPSCKYGDILELQADAIAAHWPKAISGLARALDILQEDCGVVESRWLPYASMLAPLGAVLGKVGASASNHLAAAHRQKLVRWFWCTVLNTAYDNASDSQAARDTKQLIAWLNGGAEPQTVERFSFDPNILRSTTPQQRGLYRAVMALLLSGRPRDFHTKGVISGAVMRDENVDDHHVFPRAFLKKQQTRARLMDCVLNRTLIDRATNRIIADRAPSLYMHEMRASFGDALLDEILATHLLPGGADSPLLRNAFTAFLKWRQNAIWREIQRVTGAAEAASLVDEETAVDEGIAEQQ